MTALPRSDEFWHLRILPEECHETTVHPGFYYAIRNLYQPWRLPHTMLSSDLPEITAHYERASEAIGNRFIIPEAVMTIIGYRLLDTAQIQEAIEIFTQNANLHPYSANVYDCLGEALEAHGDYEGALKQYNAAYEQAMRIDDPDMDIYKMHIANMRKKITAE